MNDNEILRSIGNALQTARVMKGVSKEELSERLRIKVANIERIESGSFSMSAKIMYQYCKAIDVSISIGGMEINNESDS